VTRTDPVSLTTTGLKQPLSLFIHGEHDLHVSRRLREEGVWEPYESSLILNLLRPGDVFVDVGANIGYFSLLAATVVGSSGQVFAFEPDPGNFELMLASLQYNDLASTVQAVQAALAEEDGEASLYLSDDNLGDHKIYAPSQQRPSLAIKLLQGSRYLQSRVQHIDLIKVDTQGAEYRVMQGLMPLLQGQQEPPAVLIELTPLSLREAGSSGRALVELLATLGQPFWIVDHIEHRLVSVEAEEMARWCDNVDQCQGDEGFINILVGPGLAAAP
jgi:FkbM family methyltransferase